MRTLDPQMYTHLAKHGLTDTDLIPGYRVTYRELHNICQMAQSEGWSGLIGLDDAVAAMAGKDFQEEMGFDRLSNCDQCKQWESEYNTAISNGLITKARQINRRIEAHGHGR